MSTWTEPASHVWSVNEQANATNLNQYHAANINATMHFLTRKMVSEALVTTSVLQDDDQLRFPVNANSTWYVWLFLMFHQSAAAHLKVAFTFPSGTITAGHTGLSTGLATIRTDTTGSGASISGGAPTSGGSFPATSGNFFTEGIIDIGSTGGTIQVQWAQSSATGTTTVHPGSCLIAQRINP